MAEFKMRSQVVDYAWEMERKLARHDHKRGWRDFPIKALLRKLKVEVDELEIALEYETTEGAMGEAVDVGNFAMMVWDRLRSEEKEIGDGV